MVHLKDESLAENSDANLALLEAQIISGAFVDVADNFGFTPVMVTC